MNDCIICFVEQGFLAKIPIDDVIDRFNKMEDRIDAERRNKMEDRIAAGRRNKTPITVKRMKIYFVFVTTCPL